MRWAVLLLIVVTGVSSPDPRATQATVGPANVNTAPTRSANVVPDSDTTIGFGGDRPAAVREDRIHAISIDGDLEAYFVQAAREGGASPSVFLTGSCTHPLEYLPAFRHAAAEHGGIIALQGDLPCGADPSLRRWSADAARTSARIDAALRAAGTVVTDDITIVGYSQGAERAEWLARRYPAKYTRFVLMAGPVIPSPARFSGARAIATLAGHGDVRENMAAGARRLRRSSIPAMYIELPGARHGDLSPDADSFIGRAFDWIDENAISNVTAPAKATDNAIATARGSRAKHRAN